MQTSLKKMFRKAYYTQYTYNSSKQNIHKHESRNSNELTTIQCKYSKIQTNYEFMANKSYIKLPYKLNIQKWNHLKNYM